MTMKSRVFLAELDILAPITSGALTPLGQVVTTQRENFLAGSDDFTAEAWSRQAVTVELPVQVVHPVSGTGPYLTQRLNVNTTQATRQVTQTTAATAGTVYCLSFWVRRDSGSTVTQGQYRVTTGTGGSVVALTTYTIGTAWTQMVVPFTTPSGTTAVTVYPFVSTDTTVGAFYLAAVQLEFGSVAKAYLASPRTSNLTVPRRERLYLSDTAVSPFPPSDPDRPNRVYDPVLIEPAKIELALSSDIAQGIGDVGGGAMVLTNGDQRFNRLAFYRPDAVVIRQGQEGDAFAAYSPVLTGVAETLDFTISTDQPNRVTIAMSDLRARLDDPVQSQTYAGTNSGPTGYEGGTDLEGSRKPLALGLVANIPATRVNASRNVFQVAEFLATDSITAIYDRGASAGLTKAADYTGAEFDSATVTSTQYAPDLSRGLVLVAGGLTSTVTFDLKGQAVERRDGSTAYSDKAPTLIAALLRRRGFTWSQIGSTFDSLATAKTQSVGVWLNDDSSYRSAIELLARSVGCWVAPDRFGVWQVKEIVAPSGNPVHGFIDDDVLGLEPDGSFIRSRIWSATVKYGRNYRPMTLNEMAGQAQSDAARSEFLKKEFRTAVVENATAKSLAGAQALEVETALVNQQDAKALAQTLMGLHGNQQRYGLILDVEMTQATLGLDLGTEVHLKYSPAGIDQNFIITGVSPTVPRRNTIRFKLWG